ncbi:MAG: isoprenylcysteine carboxylmethyltransferase family protein [Verrucomicrobia subdivision 3 bacterium]|nr:isoprenylcysteine carboxylmethyltransferase family protein [Limisphaerales bacterium]
MLAFLCLPGTFAGMIPLAVIASDRWRGGGSALGIVPLLIGLVILVRCVRDFYVAGKGTLAPWDPPKHLVVIGLYRFVRNPMYVGILLLLAGWAWLAGSPLLIGYMVLLAIAFHLRVVLYEEPRLGRQFGAEWTAYAASVPRWIPRFRIRGPLN